MMEEDLDEWFWFREEEEENDSEERLADITLKKKRFFNRFEKRIVAWTKKHKSEILDFRSFRWNHPTYEDSVKDREELEQIINGSRKKNSGGLELKVADQVFKWGFNKEFPIRDDEQVLETTRKAFRLLDRDDCYLACRTLMRLPGVGITGTTKILGLSNQSKFCIYDSRVGRAVADLKMAGHKIIRCPPGRTTEGDYVPIERWDHEWSKDYQKLIWTIEIVRNRVHSKAPNIRAADIEMALFMKGRLPSAVRQRST